MLVACSLVLPALGFFACLLLTFWNKVSPIMATPTSALDDTLKRLLDQQSKILEKLSQEPPKKDTWDKLGALTGVLVALVGGLFSFLYSYHQSKLDSINEAHQEKVQEVQTVGAFMPYLVGTDDNAKSIALAEVQSILGAKAAILIVDELNSNRKSGGNAAPDPVALRFLQKMIDTAKIDEDRDLAKKVLARVAAPATH